MNDLSKKGIIIGIVGSLFIFLSGCGRDGVAFVRQEGSLETEAPLEAGYSIEDGGAQVETDEKKTEQTLKNGESERIFVYVCGAVNTPGVYELSSDARAFQAVEKAGGFSSDACEEALNLAKSLEDGEQLVIPTVEEWEQRRDMDEAIPEEERDGLVNINTADVQELCTLPGVGESRAESIIKYREEQGSFKTIEDIKKVTGIKDGLFSKIKDKVKVK